MARWPSGALIVAPIKGRWLSSIANQYALLTVKMPFLVGAHASTSSNRRCEGLILMISATSVGKNSTPFSVVQVEAG